MRQERRSHRHRLVEDARRIVERQHERDEVRGIDLFILQSRLESGERAVNNLDALLEVVRGDILAIIRWLRNFDIRQLDVARRSQRLAERWAPTGSGRN